MTDARGRKPTSDTLEIFVSGGVNVANNQGIVDPRAVKDRGKVEGCRVVAEWPKVNHNQVERPAQLLDCLGH